MTIQEERRHKKASNGKSETLLLPTISFNRSMSYKEQQIFSPSTNTYFPYGHTKSKALKMLLFSSLEDPKSFLSHAYHSFVILLILLSLALAICMSIQSVARINQNMVCYALSILETCLALIFLIEYVLRLWSCSIKGTFKGFRGRMKFMMKPHMILDLIAIMASITLSALTINFNVDWEQMRYAMPLQLIRILRIDRQRGAFYTFHAVIKNHFKELLTCWYMGFIVVLFLSYLVYAEPVILSDNQKRTTDSLANSLYWAIVSMTTIGYGDIFPKTVTAKILICIFGVVGTGFIALPAGIIGSGFALQVIELKKKQHNRKRRRPAAMLIQAAWKVWASHLTNSYTATWIPHTKIVQSFNDGELQSLFSSHQETLVNLPGTSLRYRSGTPRRNSSVATDDKFESGGYVIYQDLTKGQKIAIGFIRHLKFVVALKHFRRTRKPYDEKDIMDQFAGGQVEIYSHLKLIEKQIDVVVDKRGWTFLLY
eukprot:gene12171-13426_t